MNGKKTNDKANDTHFGDDFSTDAHDLHEDLGDLNEEHFDDYDLNDAEEDPTTNELTTEETGLTEDPTGTSLDDLPADSQASKKGIADLVKENWLFIAIGVVVIVVAAYMIYGVVSPSAPAPAAQQQSQSFQQIPQQQAANNANAAQTPTAVTNAGGTEIVMSQADMKTLMQGFQEMVQQNSQDIQKSLQTILANTGQANDNAQAISAMQTQFANLGKQIGSYNQSMSALNKRLDTLQTQLTILVAQQTAQQEKLSLRAVVPGRAWLVDGKGRTISVTEGTQLGNFGVVTNIDSKTGEVQTSSGYIFK